MVDYHLYREGQHDPRSALAHFVTTNDETAVKLARELLVDGRPGELWRGDIIISWLSGYAPGFPAPSPGANDL